MRCTHPVEMPSHARGAIIWITGLSGSGKSTIADGASALLTQMGVSTSIVDGDILRHSICRDLGFSETDRCENIRRAGELALQHATEGKLTLVALISPFERARHAVQVRCSEAQIPFAMVYLDVDVAACERRDPKGLYERARAGVLTNFTGIDSPYEPPPHPELVISTDQEPPARSIERVVDLAMQILRRDPSFWIRL
jgi:adenylylsulfate kinase